MSQPAAPAPAASAQDRDEQLGRERERAVDRAQLEERLHEAAAERLLEAAPDLHHGHLVRSSRGATTLHGTPAPHITRSA
jgi:hypothetical protein